MYEVKLKNEVFLVEKNGEQTKVNGEIIPMDIVKEEGDIVEKGEVLIVLEAMKMENSIKSSQSGTIRKILVNIGQGVEKNQVMIQF